MTKFEQEIARFEQARDHAYGEANSIPDPDWRKTLCKRITAMDAIFNSAIEHAEACESLYTDLGDLAVDVRHHGYIIYQNDYLDAINFPLWGKEVMP